MLYLIFVRLTGWLALSRPGTTPAQRGSPGSPAVYRRPWGSA